MGALGYAVGQWVVRHRASGAAKKTPSGLPQVMVLPLVSSQVVGLTAGFQF